ncbi:hypothetical protein HN858_05610 [Candidatus Falkowbacteria bacterium]|jgi:hypothetical protein|nr:hypothetical protein [Candidatus Falkowbacteria bacterium]MBT5502899.1 hypothetical protein [Candidatus Falkowbacteria bacterium]MBT6573737.1 hypothetical protein [Candidatus Falkowbacteria bacterium]MBT7349113.1 hypothetical protein [Candidatus Falkowbacteria bacterium]MBT7500064.1 hypothetical protein [Candidatus Falkowbacteria bacterium]
MFKCKCKCNDLSWGFLYAACTVAYVGLVSLLMSRGEELFGNGNEGGYLTFVAVLLLLVLSVATVGSLLFGKPVYLLLKKDWSQAVKQLAYNLGWLLILTVIVFLFLL